MREKVATVIFEALCMILAGAIVGSVFHIGAGAGSLIGVAVTLVRMALA